MISNKVDLKLSNEQVVFLEEYRRLKHHITLAESVRVIVDEGINLFIELRNNRYKL